MSIPVIGEAVRTPIGRPSGWPSGLSTAELLGAVQVEVARRARIDPSIVEQVGGGCVTQRASRASTSRVLARILEGCAGTNGAVDSPIGRHPTKAAIGPEALGLTDEQTHALGPVDNLVGDAIVAICNEAAEQVLGPALIEALRHDRHRLALIAPWVWDLARGLQFQGRDGRPDMPTVELLSLLAPRVHDPRRIQRSAETIDLTTALTLDRLLDAVLGPGACARPSAENEAALPWLTPLKLGYRIRIALELLRLTPSG